MDEKTGSNQASGHFVLRLRDEATASAVAASLSPENGPYCETRQEGEVLVITVPEQDLRTMARTIDDVLACASAAEKAQEASS